MTGSRFNTYREAVVAGIRTILPELRTCEAIGGRFDLDQIEDRSIAAPAVLVGILQAPVKPTNLGSGESPLSAGAFVVTEGRTRDVTSWAIAEAIAKLLVTERTARWGLDNLGLPETVKIEPVISKKKHGVALIAVTWKQGLKGIGASVFDGIGTVFTGLYINDEEIDVSGETE